MSGVVEERFEPTGVIAPEEQHNAPGQRTHRLENRLRKGFPPLPTMRTGGTRANRENRVEEKNTRSRPCFETTFGGGRNAQILVEFTEHVAQGRRQRPDIGLDGETQSVSVTRCGIRILPEHDDAHVFRRSQFQSPEKLVRRGEDGIPGGVLLFEKSIDGSEGVRPEMGLQGYAPRLGQGRDHAPASPGSGSDSGAEAGDSSPLSAGDSDPENFHTPLKRAVKSPPPRSVLRKKVHVSG